MRAALEGLSNIDYVFVERSGDGTKNSNFGFSYTIFFTGNALHQRNSVSTLPLIIASECGGCIPFAYFADGTLQIFAAADAEVEVTRVQSRGFRLNAVSTTAEFMLEELEKLPSFVISTM